MTADFMTLRITSPDFATDTRLPDRVAKLGGDRPPRLVVRGIPSGTVELAIVAHDPDAPRPHGFTHWTLYGLPPRAGDVDPAAGRPGPNDAGGLGYTGPVPPVGHGAHHYYFFVYALSHPVAGTPTRLEFLDRYADAIIAVNRIVGLYER